MLSCVQEEIDKLDKEILDRHAQELADLQTRQTHEEASHDSPADVMHLADSLYDTKLSAGTQKACCHLDRHLVTWCIIYQCPLSQRKLLSYGSLHGHVQHCMVPRTFMCQ